MEKEEEKEEVEEEKRCKLCGEKIERKKGESQKSIEEAIKRGTHNKCQRAYDQIIEKHRISSLDYLNSVVAAVNELLKLERTEAMQAFNERVEAARREVEEQFPYLKQRGQK